MKYLLPGLTLCFLHFHVLAQQGKIDSLLFLLSTAREDTGKVSLLQVLARQYLHRNLDTAAFYAEQGIVLSEKIKDEKKEAYLLDELGYVNLYKSDFKNAIALHIDALKLHEKAGDKYGSAKSLQGMGFVFDMQKNFDKALEYYLQALKIMQELRNESEIATSTFYLGMVYREKENYRMSLNCFSKALDFYEKNKSESWIGETYKEMAYAYLGDKQLDSAMKYASMALPVCEKFNIRTTKAEALNIMGIIYHKQGDYKKAIELSEKSYSLANEIGIKDVVKDASRNLSETYAAINDFKNAFRYQAIYSEIKDSTATSAQVTELEAKYEQEQSDLVRQNEIRLQQAKEKMTGIILTIIVSSLVVIAFAFYLRFRSNQKANKELSIRNQKIENAYKIIEEKNTNITDSINYARRIQQAKLPKREEIHAAFPDSFVLFKPKDIVSGDFYMFHKNEKTNFIVAGDCTGHGVPGAFMSLISSEKLDDALAHSLDPSEILSHLNKGIKSSLHQTDNHESMRDGMDIALCAVDSDSCIVHYAGANRPLWIIRKGQATVEEIKATKHAIGGLTEDSVHFHTHVLQLQRGDTFYIFSDGYADTFSGHGYKKLTTKKFKEILLSIQGKSLKEQGHYLDNFIEDWMGEAEQVDDILVIGVRL